CGGRQVSISFTSLSSTIGDVESIGSRVRVVDEVLSRLDDVGASAIKHTNLNAVQASSWVSMPGGIVEKGAALDSPTEGLLREAVVAIQNEVLERNSIRTLLTHRQRRACPHPYRSDGSRSKRNKASGSGR